MFALKMIGEIFGPFEDANYAATFAQLSNHSGPWEVFMLKRVPSSKEIAERKDRHNERAALLRAKEAAADAVKSVPTAKPAKKKR